ncbi:calcium-binding protein [Caulobacter sp. NIBR1757]|uniref:calcium-binding protein n=1 Tax=Caulobacter sp. NIBR1757 TaxID=3016000 RepID=UPI0022F0CBD1|nr:calcium-binding protein [Caulobacter sp. NIBR1757]WGM37741.1 hypothetical protein AMEJIAPC_00641 [Caulobacter sp. NIBR1757]
MPLAAVINVSALNGADGFQISGAAVDDYTGRLVAAIGDINADGIVDFMVSAAGLDGNVANSGGAYVIFGRTSGFPADLNVSTLNGTNGFRISGEVLTYASAGATGNAISAAGDINGDGIADLIIGTPVASSNDFQSGAAWVLFGRNTAVAGGFASTVDLTTLNGADGFQINGVGAQTGGGSTVSAAGDVNGDGFDDLLFTAYRTATNGALSGTTYVVFGRDTAVSGTFAANLELSSLNGTNGFRIQGAAAGEYSGFAASAAGDINHDGIDDLLIGALSSDVAGDNTGAAYVVYGKNTAVSGAFAADVQLSGLNGANGFRMTGVNAQDAAGVSVAAAGDINGDGIDDLVIGAHASDNGGDYSGSTYVVFGRNTAVSGAFAASFSLSSLNGANGFRLDGLERDYSGRSVSAAGDVNGDGIDDLLIGAYRSDATAAYAGGAYLLFGRTTGFAAAISLGSLDGTTGVQINGEFGGDNFGIDVSAGDVNGDGLSDLIIGAGYADPNGANSGAAYVIFGQQGAFVGTPADQTYSGGAGADSLAGLGGKDTLSGLGGDDILDGGADNDVLYGGDGADDLIGGAGSDILNGDDGNDELNGGDGSDKLFGGIGTDLLIGGLGNDRMDGGAGVDTLNGNDGNDYLDGGLGADVLRGGLLNDVYIVDDAGDQTIELMGEGYDIVRTGLAWTLGDNLEGLELQGAGNVAGTGNGGANNLQGNSGNNLLSGLAGVDTINGNDGADTIVGGAGNDLLRGGLGADTFRVAHAFGGVLETDQIYDFSDAEGDIMDFSGAYAGTLAQVASFTRHAGEMTLTFAGGITTVRLDIDGNGVADYQVKINGDVTGDWSGWLL